MSKILWKGIVYKNDRKDEKGYTVEVRAGNSCENILEGKKDPLMTLEEIAKNPLVYENIPEDQLILKGTQGEEWPVAIKKIMRDYRVEEVDVRGGKSWRELTEEDIEKLRNEPLSNLTLRPYVDPENKNANYARVIMNDDNSIEVINSDGIKLQSFGTAAVMSGATKDGQMDTTYGEWIVALSVFAKTYQDEHGNLMEDVLKKDPEIKRAIDDEAQTIERIREIVEREKEMSQSETISK